MTLKGRIPILPTDKSNFLFKMHLDGDILTIRVDVSKEFRPSASGKTIIIATTKSNVSIPGSEEKKIGLNIYMKKCLPD